MEKYQYLISGEYKDWCEIYKGETLIHDGSLLGIVTKKGNEILLTVNYGTGQSFRSVLKSISNYIIAVPKIPDLIQGEYKFQPIIFDNKEFKEFTDQIYFDQELLKKLPQASKEDIVNIWLLSNPNHKKYSTISEMKRDTLDNILSFSDANYSVSLLSSFINAPEFFINQITGNSAPITVYIDSENGILEWKSLVKIENEVFIKLDENYYVQ